MNDDEVNELLIDQSEFLLNSPKELLYLEAEKRKKERDRLAEISNNFAEKIKDTKASVSDLQNSLSLFPFLSNQSRFFKQFTGLDDSKYRIILPLAKENDFENYHEKIIFMFENKFKYNPEELSDIIIGYFDNKSINHLIKLKKHINIDLHKKFSLLHNSAGLSFYLISLQISNPNNYNFIKEVISLTNTNNIQVFKDAFEYAQKTNNQNFNNYFKTEDILNFLNKKNLEDLHTYYSRYLKDIRTNYYGPGSSISHQQTYEDIINLINNKLKKEIILNSI